MKSLSRFSSVTQELCCKYRKTHGVMAILLTFLFFMPAPSSAKTITLVTGEFSPYSGEKLPNGGMISEIIDKAFASMGDSVEFDFRPWKRGYLETINHKYQGTFPYVKDENREKIFLFSNSLYTGKVSVFVKKGSLIKFDTDEDLQGLKTCLPRGWTTVNIQRFLDKEIVEISVVPQDLKDCFVAINTGRADFFTTNEVTGWDTINKTFGTTEGFHIVGQPLSISHYRMIVEKELTNGTKILKKLNKGLTKIQENGVYNEIVQRHLSK